MIKSNIIISDNNNAYIIDKVVRIISIMDDYDYEMFKLFPPRTSYRRIIFMNDGKLYHIAVSLKSYNDIRNLSIPKSLEIKIGRYSIDLPYEKSIEYKNYIYHLWAVLPDDIRIINILSEIEKIYEPFDGRIYDILRLNKKEWNKLFANQFKHYDEQTIIDK